MTDNRQLIWTIGYGNHSIDDFVGILDRRKIDVVVDIRHFPSIAKPSHFAKDTLREVLNDRGKQFHWVRHLGKMRKAEKDSRNVALQGNMRGFADYMKNHHFETAVDQLLTLCDKTKLAIASEIVDYENCHRKLLSDYLVLVKGCTVVHLSSGSAVAHTLTATARYEFGNVIYDYAPAGKTMLH